jgi:hypothetical protein
MLRLLCILVATSVTFVFFYRSEGYSNEFFEYQRTWKKVEEIDNSIEVLNKAVKKKIVRKKINNRGSTLCKLIMIRLWRFFCFPIVYLPLLLTCCGTCFCFSKATVEEQEYQERYELMEKGKGLGYKKFETKISKAKTYSIIVSSFINLCVLFGGSIGVYYISLGLKSLLSSYAKSSGFWAFLIVLGLFFVVSALIVASYVTLTIFLSFFQYLNFMRDKKYSNLWSFYSYEEYLFYLKLPIYIVMKLFKCYTMLMIIPMILIMIHAPILNLAIGATCIEDRCEWKKNSTIIGLFVLMTILEIIIIIFVVMTSKNGRRIGSRITLCCNCYISGHDMDAKRKCIVVLVLVIILASYFTVVWGILVFIFKWSNAMKDQNQNDFG